MESTENIELLTTVKKLLAENKSQQVRMEECDKILKARDNEIELLQTMLSEANEYRSNTDNQLMELTELKLCINELHQQVSESAQMASGSQQRVSNTTSEQEQLQIVQTTFTDMQSQLTALQTQVLDVNNRNLLLQQQTSRVAALESLLENAQAAINNGKDGHGKVD